MSLKRIYGSGIINSGIFINEDSIILNNIRALGIGNEVSFTNGATGYVLIQDSTLYPPLIGIYNALGDFLNEGTFDIQECTIGLQNADTITNQQDIMISHCKAGLVNESGSIENHDRYGHFKCG